MNHTSPPRFIEDIITLIPIAPGSDGEQELTAFLKP